VQRPFLLAATALASAGIASAQSPQPPAAGQTPAPAPLPSESEAERAAVVERLATVLDENFVFPDVARRYAQALRTKAAQGGYANLGERFAETIVADLQAIHADRHLRVGRGDGGMAGPQRIRRVPGDGAAPGGAGAPGGEPRQVMRMPDPSTAIGRSGWIADGVAYLEIGLFPGTPETVERIARFLDAHRDARAIIFDIRGHRGGGLAEMDAIFPRIFARETALVAMDTRLAVEQRRGSPVGDGPTLRRTDGPEGVVRRMHYAVPSAEANPLRNAQIYVLTSRRTGSAAEHFALSLKRTGRATLIGEPTGGAGHYGGIMDLGSGYSAFIPVGRTFDPDTDQGWEGTGVTPNVAVPADQALDEALRRAGVAPAQRRTLASASSPA
jgi:hypothetical protein